MKKTILKISYISLLLLVLLGVFSCATGRKQSAALRQLMLGREYQKALQLVQGDKFYPEKRSKLLRYVEQGTLLHITGNYYQSLKIFDRAKDLSDKLFTVSIGKKLKTAVTNDTMDNYYGERYERSLIRFYQALNHYMLYRVGKYEAHKVPGKKEERSIAEKKLKSSDRTFHLSAARATILEWDTLLENYRSTRGGKSVYKDDLTAKIFGAFIHEEIGTRSDRRIAINLLKKAKEILFKNYNTYPTLNGKSVEFRENFDKLGHMSLKKVRSDFVSMTSHQKKLRNFIDRQIKKLSGSKKKRENLYVVVQNGLISPKSARKIDFPLPIAAVGILSGNMAFAFMADLLGTASGKPHSISFELPEVKNVPTRFDMAVLIKKNGKIVKKIPMALIDPLSDVAYEAMDEGIVGSYTKIGARVAVKHVAAIGSAFATYKLATSGGTPKYLAQFAAAGAYSIANKGIAASESADLRCWQTLPHDIRLGRAKLSAGEYSVFIEKTDSSGAAFEVAAGSLKIPKGKNRKKMQFLNLRVN